MKPTKYFWVITVGLLVLACLFLLMQPKVAATYWVNQHHSPLLDIFFSYYTQIAEWLVIAIAIAIAFFTNIFNGILASVLFLVQAGITQGLKLWINAPRPVIEIGHTQIHHVANVTIHQYQSFPSGHTAAAFLGFGIICILQPQKYIQIICAFLAILVAYSRLYLGQHYLIDTVFGAGISLLLLLIFQFKFKSFRNNEQ